MTTTTLAPTTEASSAEEQYQAALASCDLGRVPQCSARQKQEMLWHFISRLPYTQLPSMRTTDFQLMLRLSSRAFLRKAFVQDDDVRPPRTKAFHTYGTVAAMRFVADGKHPFTGIFATRRSRIRAGVARGRDAELQSRRRPQVSARWTASVGEHDAAPIPGQAGQPGFL